MREIIDAMYFGQGSYTMMITMMIKKLNDKVIDEADDLKQYNAL